LPSRILGKYSYLANLVEYKLGTHNLIVALYKLYWPEWTNLQTVHLLMNHRYYLDVESPIREFNETNIIGYNYTYGYMVRNITSRIIVFF
jgi:hypothetical protein